MIEQFGLPTTEWLCRLAHGCAAPAALPWDGGAKGAYPGRGCVVFGLSPQASIVQRHLLPKVLLVALQPVLFQNGSKLILKRHLLVMFLLGCDVMSNPVYACPID